MKTILVRLFNLFSRKESITLVFVFIISLLLRINLAVKLPIWIDEAIVLNLSQNNNFYNLLSGNHWDASHPPLLHIITKLQLFLINEKHIFLYRIFHITFFSFSIFPLYLVLKKIIRNSNAAFIGILLYSTQSFILENTFTLRPYSIILFLFSVFLLIETNKVKLLKINYLIISNLLIIFSFYFDYSSLWFIIPFYIYRLIQIKNLKTFLIRFFPSIFIISLWTPIFLQNFSQLQILNMYAKNISLFQFFEQIIGIVKFWDRSEPMGLFGYYIYLSIFLNSLLYIFKNKEIKYSISIYFIFPVLFIIIYSAITTPAFIARQFISLSLLSTIFIANLFKNKKYMNLLIAIILLNIYQSITIIPNFRYLSFTNHEKLIMNNSNTISLLYPYSDLDSIDYYLRTSGFIRDLSQYNPVIFKNDTKIIYAYPSEIERLSDHNLVLIHGDIIHNNNYYKIIENECNLTKNEIDNLIYKNQSYIFYECNIL